MILLCLALSGLALAADILPSTVITQLALGTWIENIAVRPNGDLLTTLIQPSPDVIIVRHPASHHPVPELLTSIPTVSRLLGITEVASGRQGVETYFIVGDDGNKSCSAYTIAFSLGQPTVSKVIDFDSDTTFVNGVTSIPGVDNAVLVADSAGYVGYLDLSTGAFNSTAFDYPALKPDDTAALTIGVNGVKIHDGYLYFSNTNFASLSRIAITAQGHPSPGASPELVANLATIGVAAVDDFAFDKNGDLYVTSNLDNKLVHIEVPSGRSTVAVGGDLDMTVAGDTAVAFGRGHSDVATLYVVTSGAQGAPVGGNKTESAKVVAIDTSKLHLDNNSCFAKSEDITA